MRDPLLFNDQGKYRHLVKENFVYISDYEKARANWNFYILFFGFSEGLGVLRCTLYEDRGDEDGFGLEADYIFGYIDESGEMAIPFQFLNANDFSCGFAMVETICNKKCFIDKKGKVIIETTYHCLHSFSENLAYFEQDSNTHGYLNLNGEIEFLLPKDIFWADDFMDGWAPVALKESDGGTRQGYINKQQQFFPLDVDYCFTFSEGLAVFMKNGLWGYINDKLEIAIQPQFASTENFNNGLAEVKTDTHYGKIDKLGNWVEKNKFVFRK